MSMIKERLKVSIPFLVLSLLVIWLGIQAMQTSRDVQTHIRHIEQTRNLASGTAALREEWKALAQKIPESPLREMIPELREASEKTSAFLEESLFEGSPAKVVALRARLEEHLDQLKGLMEQDASTINGDRFHFLLQELLQGAGQMKEGIREAEEKTFEDLSAYRPTSQMVIFFVMVIALLWVLLLENFFAVQIRRNLITLRDTLLGLNTNRLDFDTKIAMNLKGGLGNVYPFPKIAYLFNSFLEKHKAMLGKIRTAATNCEDATRLIRNCHKEIYEGTRVQANSADETSSSSFEINATLNEIASNVQSLSRSAEGSSSSIHEMDSSIHQISEGSEEFLNLVDNSSSSINEMVASMAQIRDNLDSLGNSAEATTSSVSEVSASIREVEQMAKEAANLSQQSTEVTSGEGVKIVNKTIEGMRRIHTTVEETEKMIQKLDLRSQEIGEILNVIDEVAEQTNLLALNAAIIAAAAGEHGKGFSVVADEIKALAERTTSSIEEIERVISNVQEETKTVSQSIRQSVQRVNEGVALSEETKRALEKILTQSKKASEMSWKIEKAAIEQVKSIEHVDKETQNINQMVHQIASAVQEQDKGGSIIRETVEKLKGFAHELKRSLAEESTGSRNIATEIENFFNKIQEINRAIQEHRKGSEQVSSSIERIRVITEENMSFTDDLNTAIGSLALHNEELQSEVQKVHFTSEKNQITLGVVPLESEVKMQIKFAPLARYLEQKLQKKVVLRVARDFETSVRELGTGKTDIAYMTPSTYIEAKKLYQCRVILKAIRNHSPFYRSVIAVKEGGAIRSVSDLKRKRFGFGDQKSTSSYHIPKAMLSKEDIQLSDLSDYTFLGRHDAVAWAIVNGDVDAGGLLEPVANKFISKGLKILKISEDIPEFNFCVRADLDPELIEKVKTLLLELNEEKIEDRNIIKTIEYEYNGFMEASEIDYLGVEEMLNLSEKEIA